MSIESTGGAALTPAPASEASASGRAAQHEHEYEPQYGLPERLPADERILWQGSPHFGALARRVFHLRKLALYFGLLTAAHAANLLWSGSSAMQVLMSMRWLLPLAALGMASVLMLAWLTARTTVYTLTDKRVVMRVGIVLTVTFNVPLKTVASADLLLYSKKAADGFGDICLALVGKDRIPYLQLWPSVRPWRFIRPEPTLRCVANVQAVSEKLGAAWSASKGLPANTAAASGISQPHTAKWQAQTT